MNERKATQVIVELFDAWYPCAIRYATGLTGSTDRAEDVIQQSFLELYRALRSGKAIRSPKAWMATVVRRLAYQERSKAAAFDSDIELDALTLELVVPARDPFAQDDACRLLAVLTRREKEVVFLRLACLKYREIAEHLGIQIGTIGPLLVRALRKLQIAKDGPLGRLGGDREYRQDAGKTLQ